MKFDNAFHTKDHKVGIQFAVKGQILTVYEDHKNNIITSECCDEVKQELIARYNRRKHWYSRFDRNQNND